MIDAARELARPWLRRVRAGWRLVGIAIDQRRELGFRRLAVRMTDRFSRDERPTDLTGAEPKPERGAAFDVIYAIGYWDGEPKRYRVLNIAEGLRAAGYRVHIMPFDHLADIARYHWQATALVLFRAEYDPLVGVADALSYARSAGMRVVYDIDDLVFDTGIADRIDGLQLMGPHQRRQFIAAMNRRRRLLVACDQVTVSTAPLARAVAAVGRSSAVIPNSLNGRQLFLAAELTNRRRFADTPLRLGYFSGTRTHQRDFAACEASLLEIMKRYPRTVFRVVGYLDLGPQWEPFASRIERVGFVPPNDLLRLIAETDINLAPLELDNPFCEAKSELKFFEAAVVGVPTIASATEPFVAAIEHGRNGFIAANSNEWREALELLIPSPGLRNKIGEAARARALAGYSLEAVIPQAIAALGLASRANEAVRTATARELANP
jgi:glycosyltransferase involved in cell wall biosynthesis